MERGRSVNIQEWMLELGLKGSDLIAYALVWGFSQDGEGEYFGSLSYAARWMGLSRQQTVAVFKRLTESGLLVKKEYPGKTAHYQTAPEEPGVSNNLTGVSRNFTGGCQIIGHENKIENKEENKTIKTNTGVDVDKRPYGEKVLLSIEEWGKLVDRFGSKDTNRLCQILDDYLVNHPKKHYVSHYRAILSWCVDRLTEMKTNEQKYLNATGAGQRSNPGQRTTYADVQRKIWEMEAKKGRR